MESSTVEEMKIFLRTIPLDVEKTETIKKVRDAFAEIGVLKANLKKLFFAGNYLENDRRLVDYDIQNGSIVEMFLEESGVRTSVHIKMSQVGKTVTIDVNTVRTVKEEIQNKEGITASEMNLFYYGQVLDDSQLLGSYNIGGGSIIHALFRFGNVLQVDVSIEPGMRIINLKAKSWYTIENVMNMIEIVEGIPAKKQKLYMNKQKLEANMTLADLNIQPG